MNKITRIYLQIVLGLFPVVFMPIFTDIYGYGKLWWWMALGFLGIAIWAVGRIITRNDKVKVSGGLWVMLLLSLWAIISWIREGVGVRERSFYAVSGLGTIVASTMWYFLALQVKSKDSWMKVLRIPAVIAAVSSLIVFLIPESNLPISWPTDYPIFNINQGWSLAGGVLGEVILLAVVGIMGAKTVADKLKKGENYIVDAVVTAVVVLGLFLDFYKVFKLGWGSMDLTSAWMIAVETFKRSPLWGIGVGNFIEAFNLFRPASYNLTNLWSTTLSQSSMVGLQLWTELGIVGLALLAVLVVQVIKAPNSFEKWLGALALVAAMLLPFSTMTWWLIVVGLALAANAKETVLRLASGENSFNVMPIIVGVLVLGIAGFGGYQLGKNAVAESMFKRSLIAASKNDGGKAYEWQGKAIGVQPNMADYRKSYSLTNLAIAQSLLSNKDITDADKEKVSILLQQAVREAKAAATLDSMNTSYWTNLAVIYKAMIGLVDGSADWAVQAYQQAILLDPVNPLLQLDYGGLLFAAGDYESANRIFEEAVTNKSDYANAWYNWAHAAKKSNRLYDAVTRLNQAVSLVPADSGDYETANKELTEWKKEYDEAVKKYEAEQKAAQAQQEAAQKKGEGKDVESLSTPEPLPTVGEEEKVNVPAEELEPPATTPMPTVTPTVQPTAQPTGSGN